jgi:hypothetical protein
MWTDFFVAAAGASAALAGLVIVAISVNINSILEALESSGTPGGGHQRAHSHSGLQHGCTDPSTSGNPGN